MIKTKWIEQFNVKPLMYEIYLLAEKDFKSKVEQFLKEVCGVEIEVDFDYCRESNQLGIMIDQQNEETDERLSEVLGDCYWDNSFNAMFGIGQAMFGKSFEIAMVIPTTFGHGELSFEFYCLKEE